MFSTKFRDFPTMQMLLRAYAVSLASLIVLSGCSSGIDRLEDIGAKATEQLVNFKTENGFRMINMRMVDVTKDVDFDKFLEIAPSVRDLKTLRVFGHKLSCEQVDRLVALGGLTTIVVEGCEVEADCLAKLAGMQTLETVSITLCPVTSEQVGFVKDLPRLSTLTLIGTQVDDSLLSTVVQLPRLRNLILSDTHVTDAFASGLPETSKIDEIHLDNTAVTSAGVVALASLPSVTRIHAAHVPLSDTVSDALVASSRLKAIVLDVTEKQARDNRTGVKLLPPGRASERDD